MRFNVTQKILIISYVNNHKKFYFTYIYFSPALIPVEGKGIVFLQNAQVASKIFFNILLISRLNSYLNRSRSKDQISNYLI